MITYTVVDNIHRGEGFYFVITDLSPTDRWKYGIHGEYTDKAAAQAEVARLNSGILRIPAELLKVKV